MHDGDAPRDTGDPGGTNGGLSTRSLGELGGVALSVGNVSRVRRRPFLLSRTAASCISRSPRGAP